MDSPPPLRRSLMGNSRRERRASIATRRSRKTRSPRSANGLLGLTVPKAHGGLGQGPRTAAAAIDAVATLPVHCGPSHAAASPATPPHRKTAPLLEAAAAGRHLSTLAFSEKGLRSHFWAPVSRASGAGNGAVSISAQSRSSRRRARRWLRRLDALDRRDAAARDARFTSSSTDGRAVGVARTAATPARR